MIVLIYIKDMVQALVHKIIDVYIPAYNAMDKGIVERYGSILKKLVATSVVPHSEAS